MRANVVDRDGAAGFAGDRREHRILEPACRDPFGERGRIEIDVERIAVRRHPARDVDADRGDLPRRAGEPDPGEPVDALTGELERRDRLDERFLEVPDVLLDVAAVPGEV